MKYLSPTFFSSAMFCIFSFIYVLVKDFIGVDISKEATNIILLSILAITIGELFASKLKFISKKNYHVARESLSLQEIAMLEVPNSVSITLFIIMLFIAFMRIYDLNKSLFSFGYIVNILATSRSSVVTGNFNSSFGVFGIVVSFGTIMSQVIGEIYIFLFVVNARSGKKNNVMLLPIIGQVLVAVSTTSRIGIVLIAVQFVIAYFFSVYVEKNENKKVKPKIIKIAMWLIFFIVLFFSYGLMIRKSISHSNTLLSHIISYSCSSLYGLTLYLENPWRANPYFGYHTLQKIYNFFRIQHNIEGLRYAPTFLYGVNSASNIYTSLPVMLSDYGILGMFFLRVVFSFITVKLELLLIQRRKINTSFFIVLHFVFGQAFCYILSPIADEFGAYYFNPRELYSIIAIVIATKLIFKFKSSSRNGFSKSNLRKIQ